MRNFRNMKVTAKKPAVRDEKHNGAAEWAAQFKVADVNIPLGNLAETAFS